MTPPVFSAAWFARHQRVLLGLLNAPVIGAELRAALAIRRHDVGHTGRIAALYPHAYVVANPDGTFTLDVRTHHKYAKRLRHEFDPIWRAAHAWDRFVANPLLPALNLGFDTLGPIYPDPGDPGTTTCDGYLRRQPTPAEDFPTIHAGANTSAAVTDTVLHHGWARNAGVNLYDIRDRTVALFDTSALGSAATISAAVPSFYGQSKLDSGGANPDLDVYTATTASNATLASGDSVGSVSQTGAPMAYSAFNTSSYNDFPFNATGISNISKTGVSKVGTRNANYDVAVSTPPDGEFKFDCYAADQAGNANDPKMVITFTGSHGEFHGGRPNLVVGEGMSRGEWAT